MNNTPADDLGAVATPPLARKTSPHAGREAAAALALRLSPHRDGRIRSRRVVRTLLGVAGLLWVGAAMAGCSSLTNGRSVTPIQTQTTLSTAALQLAVGTARLPSGATGLNVVSTFRQTTGLSATLVNTPTLTGPSGFVVPKSTLAADTGGGNSGSTSAGSGGSGTDGGTNHISGTPQQQFASPAPATSPAAGTVGTTLGQNGGIFASGIAPFNAQQSTSALYPGSQSVVSTFRNGFVQPFYVASASATTFPLPIVNGPPAVPFFNDGTYGSGFSGYLPGFSTFAATPVAGAYTLSVLVAAANANSQTFTATGTIASTNPLPALAAPAFVKETAAGGATWTVAVPADARIVETLLYVIDVPASGTPNFFTVGPQTGTGTLTFALPGNLGACAVDAVGCSTGPNAGPTIGSGDTYVAFAASFDYKQFEAEPPGNTTQSPTLTGSGGQSDVSLSPTSTGTY